MGTWALIVILRWETSWGIRNYTAYVVPGFSSQAACEEAGKKADETSTKVKIHWRCQEVR